MIHHIKIRKIDYLLLGLLTILLMSFSTHSNAQPKDLEINKIFKKYGKSQDAIMVEMNRAMLKEYQFNYYKSITIENNEEANELTRKYLEIDQKDAKRIKEINVDGKTVSVLLQLPPKKGMHRVILLNIEEEDNSNKMILIYIESKNKNILDIILNN